MNYLEFRDQADRWMKRLTDKTEFTELMARSRENERVRNAFAFYLLSDYHRFGQCLYSHNSFDRQLLTDVLTALNSSTLTGNVRMVARDLRTRFFFRDGVSKLLTETVPSPAVSDYVKYLTSLVREHEFRHEETFKSVVQEKMNQVNFDKLFV